MAKPNLLLLQVLTKNRNAIRDGVIRIQDVVTDYFKSGGKDLEVSDRAIIENFFSVFWILFYVSFNFI